MKSKAHWDRVYRTNAEQTVSWYQPTPATSLGVLDRFQVPSSAALIDVGGGTSGLVDALVERGWTDLTVLDIAAPALDLAQARLGPAAGRVQWLVADITRGRPGRSYDVWHDRSVFHFLTDVGQRAGYRQALEAGVAPGDLVIIATFAPDGPARCSGLPVQRYDAAALSRELGPGFRLVDSWREDHVTPNGDRQAFSWCVFDRTQARA